MKTHVLYHAHCADGFGAAYAAWLALGDADVVYLPVSYGEALPEIADGSRVYILDFSYSREVLEQLAGRTTLRVIDHHKTAAEALEGLDCATFDLSKSGAILTWEHFQGTGLCLGEAPALLRYVQDRDLWKWELPHSRAYSAALALHPKTFQEWFWLSGLAVKAVAIEGAVVLRYQRQLVESIADRAVWRELNGHDVPMANTPVLISEVCEELLVRHPSARFAANYFRAPAKVDPTRSDFVYSLRSRPDFDVSAIARQYDGGGGHAQAAGFTLHAGIL